MERRLLVFLLLLTPILSSKPVAPESSKKSGAQTFFTVHSSQTSSSLPSLSVPSQTPISVSIRLANNTLLTGAAAARHLSVSTVSPSHLYVKANVANSHPNLLLSIASNSNDKPHPRARLTVVLHSSLAPPETLNFEIAESPPVVHAVRSHRVIPFSKRNVVQLEVSRAHGSRRLILSDRGATFVGVETAYVRSTEDKWLATFVLPAFPLDVYRRGTWRLEVENGGIYQIATDEKQSLNQWTKPKPPKLTAINPDSYLPGRESFAILFGQFDPRRRYSVFFADIRVPANDVVDITTSEIHVRLSSRLVHDAAKRTRVKVGVVAQGGLKSELLDFVFDPNKIAVSAVALQSSFNSSSGQYLIPRTCDRWETPTVLARLEGNTDGDERAKYMFSVRTSDMPANKYLPISVDQGNIVALNKDLFKEGNELKDEAVAVLVQVSIGERTGQTAILISRQLHSDTIGLTVLPSHDGVGLRGAPFVLDAELSPMHTCHSEEDLEMSFSWVVNGQTVSTPKPAPLPSEIPEHTPVMLGFGNRIVLPPRPPWGYKVKATLLNKKSKATLAVGSVNGQINLSSQGSPPLSAILNGGARAVFVPVGKNFTIRSTVLDDALVEVEEEDVQYNWGCVEISNKKECPESIFSSDLADLGKAGLSSFSISASDTLEGKAFQFSLNASLSGKQSRKSILDVTFVSANSKLFPDADLQTRNGLSVPVDQLEVPLFQQHDIIILTIKNPLPEARLDFGLFQSGNTRDLIEGKPENLIDRPGYWSPKHTRSIKFFGIEAAGLQGKYRLCGAVGESASIKKGSCWDFSVASKPKFATARLPITKGFAKQTRFHAAVTSTPAAFHQFVFSLRQVGGAKDSDNDEEHKCLGLCNGSSYVSFSVSRAGTFVVHVDIYDATGTKRVATAQFKEEITVVEANETDSGSPPTIQDKLSRSVACGDEEGFLSAVSEVPEEDPSSSATLELAVDGLKFVSGFPSMSPLRMAHVIRICTNLIAQDELSDLEFIESIRAIVEHNVQQILPFVSVGPVLKASLGSFYGTVEEKVSFIGTMVEGEGTGSVIWKKVLNETRQASSRDMTFVMSTGQECGYTDHLLVRREKANLAVGQRSESFDDYRIGISCFKGQITSLGPAPGKVEICEESTDVNISDTARNVWTSIERKDSFQSLPDKFAASPSTFVDVVHVKQNGSLEEGSSASRDECVTVRATAPVSLKEPTLKSPSREQRLPCPGAGSFSVTELEPGFEGPAKNISIVPINDFLYNTSGSISALTQVSVPSRVKMEVNVTLLEVCHEQNSVDGQRTSGALLATVIAIGSLFLIAGCLAINYFVACYYRSNNRKPRSNVAPAMQAGTDEDPSSGDSNLFSDREHTMNAWEAEYTSASAGTERGVITSSTTPGRGAMTPAELESSNTEDMPRSSKDKLDYTEWQPRPRISGLDGFSAARTNTDMSGGPSTVPVPSANFLSDSDSSQSLEYVVLDIYGRSGTPG